MRLFLPRKSNTSFNSALGSFPTTEERKKLINQIRLTIFFGAFNFLIKISFPFFWFFDFHEHLLVLFNLWFVSRVVLWLLKEINLIRNCWLRDTESFRDIKFLIRKKDGSILNRMCEIKVVYVLCLWVIRLCKTGDVEIVGHIKKL